MQMDDSRIAMKEKLEFVGIIKEALKIPIKNPKFIFTILLTFFPLFCSLCLHETMFQRALIESLRSRADDPPPHEGFVSIHRYSWPSLYVFRDWIGNFISRKLLVQSFTFLAIIHLFDLLNTIITVSTASAIYAQEKETLTKPFIENKNKHGDVALGVSAYISRGSRKRGFLIMLVFFAWSFGLRLSSLCVGWQKGNVVIEVILAQACLDCLGSVMKWVAFMIYFYDCMKRFIEKKFDGSAEGKA
ncbi:hypothetical protein AB3S75_012159 [Citrus x aurantiifolia]